MSEQPGKQAKLDDNDSWTPELPASMVRRGLAALPDAPPPPPKVPPPGADSQDMWDLVALGIIASWREQVKLVYPHGELSLMDGVPACLGDLTSELLAWNSCQRLGCSEIVFREACAVLSMGDPDAHAAEQKRCAFMQQYQPCAIEWNQIPTSLIRRRGREHEGGPRYFPRVDLGAATARRGPWGSCFCALTSLVCAADDNMWDNKPDFTVLRLWRDAASHADLANVYAEVKWGISKQRRQWNPVMWLTQLATCAMGADRDPVMNALYSNMGHMTECIRHTVYISSAAAAADLQRYKEQCNPFVLSMNGFVNFDGTHLRILTATVLWNNVSLFRHLLSLPEVDINARTIVDYGGMTDFPPLLAIPIMLASKVDAQVMLHLLLARADLEIEATDLKGNTVLHLLVTELLGQQSHKLPTIWMRFANAMQAVRSRGVPLMARGGAADVRHRRTARDTLMQDARVQRLMDLPSFRKRHYRSAAAEIEAILY